MVPVTNFSQALRFFSPELILSLGVIVLLLATLVPGMRERRNELAISTLVILAVAGTLLYTTNVIPFMEGARPAYLDLGNNNRILRVDKIGVFFKGLFLTIAALGVILSVRSKELMAEFYGEFCAFILAVTLGMILMATSVDMLMIYLSVEMVSILSYVLAGYMRGSTRAAEASLKYLLYGALSSGIMIYGMSILYGYTGSLNLLEMKAAFSGHDLSGEILILLAVIFVIAGIGYKMASVPFHFWCPDVYEGAPLPVTAFFSVGPKAAGFALAIRFFASGFTEAVLDGQRLSITGLPEAQVVGRIDWVTLVFILSIATMTLGNLAAIRQKNAKRMMAYSSIAHAGYILMGLTTLTTLGIESILIYLVIYVVMNLGAFAVIMMVADARGSDDIEAFRGTFKNAPWVAISMCVFLFSLTGLPPLAGFIGKFSVFSAVIERANSGGPDQARLWVLAAVGAINSAISLFYYMRIVVAMLSGSIEEESDAAGAGQPSPLNIPLGYQAILALFVLPTVILGVAFGWLKTLAEWTLTYNI